MKMVKMMRRKPRAPVPADEDGKDDEEETQGPADDPGNHAQMFLQVQHQNPFIALGWRVGDICHFVYLFIPF